MFDDDWPLIDPDDPEAGLVDKLERQWLQAVQYAEQTSDLRPLTQLLRHPQFELRRGERRALAELFDRRRLAKNRGGQQTPIGKISAEGRLRMAARHVKQKQADGLSREVAIKLAKSRYKLKSINVLRNHLDGKRGATRRRKNARR